MATQTATPTREELAAQYRRANLRRHGIGLARLLANPAAYKTLCLGALAARRKQKGETK